MAKDDDGCVLCGQQVSADTKSPVPKVCYICYEDQSRIETAMEESKAHVDEVEAPVAKAGAKRAGSALQPPPDGWKRKKRESEMVWFARVQMHRHGPEKRKQIEYTEQWKSFDEKHKQRFRQEVADILGPEVVNSTEEVAEKQETPADALPWFSLQGDRAVVKLPKGYTLDDLLRDFGQFSENPSAHDQKRWEMYCLLDQLMNFSQCEIRNPSQAASAEVLKPLRINKHYLYKLRNIYGSEELPWDVPSTFKMGRTPQASLSEREKLDLLTM